MGDGAGDRFGEDDSAERTRPKKKKALWLDDAICQIEIKFQIIDELIDY